MALIKNCDRCKRTLDKENDIGVVVGAYRLIPENGYIRPSQKLLGIAKQEDRDLEYFPVQFAKHLFGQIDLCQECFDDFMKLPTPQE